ncbi:MAG: restriction endonuclease subunit S [Desulfuromonadales bacterium]
MSSKWETIKLNELLEIKPRNGLYKGKEFQGTGNRWVKMKDIYGKDFILDQKMELIDVTESELEKFGCKKDDLLFGRTSLTLEGIGDCAIVGKVKDVPIFESNLFRLRIDQRKADSYFYYYYFKSPSGKQAIQSIAKQTAATSITATDLVNLIVPFPKYIEQNNISQLLISLDKRIALLRETNTTLEAIAQALFKSWFVDFDPVHAKLEGREPEGMDADTAALFPDSFEESEMGLVPKGWQWSTVDKSFKLIMGQSPPGDTYNSISDGLPFYQGKTDFGFRFPSQRIFCTAPTRIAELNDTLVSVRAPVGDVNMALEKCCLGRGVAGIRHPDGHHSYVFYSIRNLRSYFDHFDGEGTVFGSINKKDFQGLPVISPPMTVLNSFDGLVSPIDSRIQKNERKLQTLTEIRDTLLPRLVSGQLRLPDAEALIREV